VIYRQPIARPGIVYGLIAWPGIIEVRWSFAGGSVIRIYWLALNRKAFTREEADAALGWWGTVPKGNRGFRDFDVESKFRPVAIVDLREG
jgi:hypothetical protein